MTTETTVANLKINKLTQAQYSTITPSETELYMVVDSSITIVQTYVNGASWYRIYSDGWCEQGGEKPANTDSIVFLIEFADTNYYYNSKTYRTGNTSNAYNYYNTKTTTGIKDLQITEPGFWFACGYKS